MAYRFEPPRDNALVIGTVNLLYPALLALRDRIVRIEVEPSDWRRIEGLRDSRALLLPNHPSETEPAVIVGLARRLRRPFNYVATHEIFHGARGWVINRMGAFTMRRGWPDRASLRMSRRLLAEKDRKLVLFPEGETHSQNDLILPLYRGAVRIGFWALEDLERSGRPPRLPLLPIVIKYRFVGDPRPALSRGLRGLEAHLGLPSAGGSASIADRLRHAGLEVLRGVEREYGVAAGSRASDETPIDARIALLFDGIAGRVTHLLGVAMPADPSVRLRMRALYNATFDYLDGLAAGKTPYERRLHLRRVAAARTCLADLWRVQNFMTISEDCLAELSAERAGELLFRLEKEVFGHPRTRPWREAVVRIGPPMELAEWLPQYRASRKKTVANCTAIVEQRLRSLLESLSPVRTPL